MYQQIGEKKNKKKWKLLLSLSLSQRMLWHRAALYAHPTIPPPRWGDFTPAELGWAELIPVMFYCRVKWWSCPLWCFERKLYRNNVPGSVAIENPSQREFATRGKAA